jgi:hypothetical protein
MLITIADENIAGEVKEQFQELGYTVFTFAEIYDFFEHYGK